MAKDWALEAACRGMDPDMFFPQRGSRDEYRIKAVCAACPVAADCLEWALVYDERLGWWGGIEPRERRRMQLKRMQRGGIRESLSRQGQGWRESDCADVDLRGLHQRGA